MILYRTGAFPPPHLRPCPPGGFLTTQPPLSLVRILHAHSGRAGDQKNGAKLYDVPARAPNEATAGGPRNGVRLLRRENSRSVVQGN